MAGVARRASSRSPGAVTSVRGVSTNRRRQRSVRTSVAVVLLVVATAAVGVSLGTGWQLGAGAVTALACGITAARMLSGELAQSRRDAGHDRAEQAAAYGRLSSRTAAEHGRFVAQMAARIADRDRVVGRLRRALRVALRRADAAADRARQESDRSAALTAEVSRLQAELVAAQHDDDQLAGWEGAWVPPVVDLPRRAPA